jgi:hypothetical protein
MPTILSLDVVDRPFDRITIDRIANFYVIMTHTSGTYNWRAIRCSQHLPIAAQVVINKLFLPPEE